MAENIGWEQETIQKLLFEQTKELKRRRRWRLVYKILFFSLFIFIALALYTSKTDLTDNVKKPHVGLIDIRGPIFDMSQSNADNIATGLRKAFKDKQTKGVILRINSPGGSPVQAAYVYDEILRMKKTRPDLKVVAVCVDLCASAAYYIAAAADDIYANQNSLVGSIGVVFNGFGFTDTMEKLGVERRLLTAGDHKGYMDPFSPQNPEETAFTHIMLNEIHQQFIHSVQLGRGKRLKNDPKIFSGLIWTGVDSKNLGLIDGFASSGTVARNVFKTNNIVDYTKKPSYVERIAKRFGTAFAGELTAQLGQRVLS